MPTLEPYNRLMSAMKFHEAAREACRCAAEIVTGMNRALPVEPSSWSTMFTSIQIETVQRYLHLVRAAVRSALGHAAWDELRAIRDDKELGEVLDDSLREEIVNELNWNAPTLVMTHPSV